MRADMVRAYVEKLLEELTRGDVRIRPDEDGDYPVRYRNSRYFVRLIGELDPHVQVFAAAVMGIEPSPALFEALNSINADIRFARVFWVRGQVLVEADLVGSTLDPAEFDNACGAVASITDHYAPLLAEDFGGNVFEPAELADEPAQPPVPTGQYL